MAPATHHRGPATLLCKLGMATWAGLTKDEVAGLLAAVLGDWD